MNPATDPVHIAISKSTGIRIDWKDGRHSEYGLQYLRDNCPCASCAAPQHSPADNQELPPFPMYTPTLKIESVEPAGNYAIKIRWSDGHDAGIYTFEYLRSISRPAPADD